jgi:hypothetical protein
MKAESLSRTAMIRAAQAALDADSTASGATLILPDDKGNLEEIYLPARREPAGKARAG